MCLIGCHVRINGTPSGPGVPRGSGDHHGTDRAPGRDHRIRGVKRSVRNNTRGVDEGGTALTAHPTGIDGLRSPTANYRSAMADHRPTDEAVPALAVWSYRDGATDTNSDNRTGRSQEETRSHRKRRSTTEKTCTDDPVRTAIWKASPQFKDIVSECLDVGSEGGPSCSPGSRRQRPEISWHSGHFRVRSNKVERLDCSTPDGNTTQAHNLSRRIVEDAVPIPPLEGNRLMADLATRPGGRNDSAG